MRSGYARVAYEVHEGLKNFGHQVETVVEGSGCRRIWNFPFLTQEGKRTIESSEAVIIIGPSPPFTEQAFKVAKQSRLPVLYVTNAFVGISSYVDNLVTRAIDRVYEQLVYHRRLNKSRFVFAQTEGFARYLNLKKPVNVSPYGLRYLPSAYTKTKERSVLFVGQFRHYKGIRYLLEAAMIMKSMGECPLIDVAGSGPLLGWMRKKIEKNGLKELVNLHVAPDDKTLAELYATNRVFVLPSISAESFGFVLLEAASQGMSIVTSDLPGLADVSRSLGGEVVPRRNAEALAKKISEMMNSDLTRSPDLSPFTWEKNVGLLDSAVRTAVMSREGERYALSVQN